MSANSLLASAADIDTIPASLREDTAVHIERVLEAANQRHADAPPLDERLVRFFAASPGSTEFAVREPAAFTASWTAAPRARPAAEFEHDVVACLAASADADQAKRALRRLRNAEMVRIAIRDIVHGASVPSITAELSALADACIRHALVWLQAQLAPRLGQALDANGEALELLVLAMGKLGGQDLNFSSDIDLQFIYRGPGETAGGRRQIDHQAYFDRLGKMLIALLGEVTEDGFVFRVDMRLRPFGESGPLTTSLGALEQYYAVHGRDWERYALIKARVVCGDAGCRTQLLALIEPFVYRRYFDFGALEALRKMKSLIDKEASTQQLENDIKRGVGCIREIEFIAQLFQLTRGGREPRLRDGALLSTLTTCAELGLLDASDVDTLRAAYLFFRRVEHRLQQVNDQHTHALPTDDKERDRLVVGMGCNDWDDCLAALSRHRGGVHTLFAALLGGDGNATDAHDIAARDVWLMAADTDALAAQMAALGFNDGSAASAALQALITPRFRNRLSEEARARLDRLMPLLLSMTARCTQGETTLERLSKLIHAIARRSVYCAFLADYPDALARVVELFESSSWVAEQITRYPILLDALLDTRELFTLPTAAELHQAVHDQVQSNRENDLEHGMDALRSFKNQQVLRVAASDISRRLPLAEISNQLTYVAEACLSAALQVAWHDLVQRHGEPRCEIGGATTRPGFAIVGYGKLGGWELGYGSDLDIVFLHDSSGAAQHTTGDKPVENAVFFTRLAQRLIHILSTSTHGGKVYDIDVRLRPSGASGLLVSTIDAFRTYQENKAWLWEHQALVRARGIVGDRDVIAAFESIRRDILERPRSATDLKREIADMRARMLRELDRTGRGLFDLKHGSGAITDIEFVVQYMVLRWAFDNDELLAWTDNLRLLETFADHGLMPPALSRRLHDAYFAIRAEIHRCTLQQVDGLVDEKKLLEHRHAVTEIWQATFATDDAGD